MSPPLFVVALVVAIGTTGVSGDLKTMHGTLSSDAVDGSRIFKCSCGVNEAISNGSCAASPNPIRVWDEAQNEMLVVEASSFPTVAVNPVSCQEGYSKLSLADPEFFVYPNGLLHNVLLTDQPPTEQYCLDHLVTTEGLILIAEVCSLNPVISTCCPPGQVSNAEGNCVFNESLHFNPRLTGGFPWSGFNLTEHNIECGEGQILLQEYVTDPSETGVSLVSYPLGNKVLWNSIYNTDLEYIPNDKYCINVTESEYGYLYWAQFCAPDPREEHINTCTNSTCLRKCCPHGFIFDTFHLSCVPDLNFQVNYKFFGADDQEIPEPENVTLKFGFPFCAEKHLLPQAEDPADPFLKFSPDGSLIISEDKSFSSLSYCVDGFTFNFTDPNRTVNNTVIVCFKTVEAVCEWRWILGSVLIAVSCLFYIATLIVHVAIEELRSKMFGKCLISQVSALLVAYITLIFLQNTDNYSQWTCNIPGTIEHIAILAAFFWLNVMCYDMWVNITTVRSSKHKTSVKSKRFWIYCIYAWGVPLLIGAVRVIIDHVPDTEDHHGLVRSNIGKTHCFFTANYSLAKWVYLYGPILVLLLINLGFFVHVAFVILKTKNEANKLMAGGESHRTGKNYNAKKERALLYLKLFLVMGISWLLEIIMWVAVPESDCYFWGFDTVNLLQGVFIFVIFVCKKSTMDKIKETFSKFPSPSHLKDEYILTSTENERGRRDIGDVVA